MPSVAKEKMLILERKKKHGALYKFRRPTELQKAVDKYFDDLDEIPTFSGLASFLGTTTTKLVSYTDNEDYKEIIDNARQKIEAFIVGRALTGELKENMAKFYLKNIDGRKDETMVKTETKNENIFRIEIVEPPVNKNIQLVDVDEEVYLEG